MIIKTIGKVAVTTLFVVVAAVVVWNIWIYYEEEPRTRDGRIRADVVTIASDVAGGVVEVAVTDDQTVEKGDLLFRIDPSRYDIAVKQARASLENARATATQAQREADRYERLGKNVASVQTKEQAATEASKAQAALQGAQAALDLAKLNLERTSVTAPVNGIVTNLGLRVGDYVAAGSPITALVDSDSFHAVGYFEETKLSAIHIDDAANVTVMGEDGVLHGHVAGISAAIAERDRTTGSDLLPNVNPSFTWVRLAQRVPVRIALDDVPDNFRFLAGRTASVEILQNSETPDARTARTTAGEP